MAEDLESRLSMGESKCLGRLTVDKEHLPEEPRERHTVVQTVTWLSEGTGNLLSGLRTVLLKVLSRFDLFFSEKSETSDGSRSEPEPE